MSDNTTVYSETTTRFVRDVSRYRAARREEALTGSVQQRTYGTVRENVRLVYRSEHAAAVFQALITLAEAGVYVSTDQPDGHEISKAWQAGRDARGES